METVYVVMKNSDFTEGRGPMVLDSIWSNPSEAILYANSLEPYGATLELGRYGSYAYGQFIKIEARNIHEKFIDKRAEKEAEAKRIALAKLSSSERKLLGLE